MEVAIARHLYQLSMGEIIQAIAEEFLGKAYKAGLLDKSTQETLTISLTEFDCVLFVETVLAIARNLALQDYSYQTFTNHIRNQRYLNDVFRADHCITIRGLDLLGKPVQCFWRPPGGIGKLRFEGLRQVYRHRVNQFRIRA
ncbi:MAG: DUF1460 domain-containing protein, partial [Merismopedia sp. SIO2A8]|nr:DUF1460 domain-containing protein [Merismopedia sp. SIO2A8]